MSWMKRAVLVCAVATIPSLAVAQNTTPGTQAPLEVNGPYKGFTLDAVTTTRWYSTQLLVPGRSYCVEVIGGAFENNFSDSVVTVYESNTTTIIPNGENDDANTEPDLWNGSRVCFIANHPNQTAGSLYFIKVEPFSALASTRSFQIRVVETTLFSPWFQVLSAAGYDAAPQIKNNSNVPVNIVFLARAANGTPLAGCPTTTTAIPANGTATFGISSRCATTNAFGGAQIAHDGPPGALSANTTTFSGASGLSFDAPFTPRQNYN